MSNHKSFALVSGIGKERIVLCGLTDVDNKEAERLISFHGMDEFMKVEGTKEYFYYQRLHVYVEFEGEIRYAVGHIFRPPFYWSEDRVISAISECFDSVVIES